MVAAVFVLHLGFFHPREWYGISDKDKFSGPFWEKELTISIFDYLPIYAKLPPTKVAPLLPEILEGKAEFLSYQKHSDYQTGKVTVEKEALFRLPLFDFPGMAAFVDKKKTAHWHDDCRGQEYCLGLITFKVPIGTHIIKAKLEDTPVRKTGNMLTLFSIFSLALLIYLSRKHEKLV